MITDNMRRKVIQLSVKTLVVSLPTDWAVQNNIKKGGEVEVAEKGDRLVISSANDASELMKIVLVVDDRKVFDKRYIGDLYIKGYDEIKVVFKNSEVLDEVKKVDLLGYEVVETGTNYCVIKNVLSALESEFDTMLRKCFLLSKEMALSICQYLGGKNINLKDIRALEAENGRASVFCLRVLNKNGYKDGAKTTFNYVIAREIEAICDIFKYIIDDLSEGGRVSKDAKEYYCDACQFFISFYEIFYKYEPEKFKRFYSIRKELINRGRGLIKKGGLSGDIAHHSLNLVVATYNICGPFLTMNFKEIYEK
jgi:phosphate uptake regulator